jgi:hypothetical protein
VSVILGVVMVAETLLLLRIGWSHFGLATNNNALYTFSFLMLLYFAVFSVVSARERRAFWSTMPSKAVMAALMADPLAGTILTRVGLPGLMPLPWGQTLAIFAYAMVSCLVVNDAVKVVMINHRPAGGSSAWCVRLTPNRSRPLLARPPDPVAIIAPGLVLLLTTPVLGVGMAVSVLRADRWRRTTRPPPRQRARHARLAVRPGRPLPPAESVAGRPAAGARRCRFVRRPRRAPRATGPGRDSREGRARWTARSARYARLTPQALGSIIQKLGF